MRPGRNSGAQFQKYAIVSGSPCNRPQANLKYVISSVKRNFLQVFIVDTRANKKQIKDSVHRLYDIQTRKINTLIRYASACLPNASTPTTI